MFRNATAEEVEQIIFKLCCLYYAKTELYDRTLTDKRSRHDPTEAFIDNSQTRMLSNKYAIELRKKIIDFGEKQFNLRRDFLSKRLKERGFNHYSAQGWIDMYNHLKENGELKLFEGLGEVLCN